MDELIALDQRYTVYLHHLRADWLDPLMLFLSGIPEWIPLYLFLIFLMYREFGKVNGTITLVCVLLVFVATDRISHNVFKPYFMRLRPCQDPEIAPLLKIIEGTCYDLYGFLSSHSASTFGLAVYCFSTFRKVPFLPWFMLVWAAVVAYSRIYLGAHYLGDVICGTALGILCGIGGIYLRKYALKRFGKSS